MKVSIITAVYNGSNTIEDCIKSVASQTFSNIEHIIIDGGSKDGTLDVIKKHKQNIAKVISEPDTCIYDAMNKGLNIATGDIVGILNSDDVYANEFVIEDVVKTIDEKNVDSCYGDLVYVEKNNINKIVRYWRSGNYYKERFNRGWMPPHPTFFVKKYIYEKYGLLNLDFPLAADYELMLRFLYKHRISSIYIPKILVKMRNGGTSKPGLYTIRAIEENYRAWKINGLDPSPITFILKPLSKIPQYIKAKNYFISR